jgi:hypothetical protein
MRKRKENDIVTTQRFRGRFLQSQPKARQVRVQRPEWFARIRPCGYRDNIEFGVPGK